jgi:hypothetical protein
MSMSRTKRGEQGVSSPRQRRRSSESAATVQRFCHATLKSMPSATMPLFEPAFPDGFAYRPAFITPADEAALIGAIGSLTFADFAMRGVVARRRVAFFGETYDRAAAGPVPDFLLPLRAAVAEWAHVAPAAFAMALINEYRPGAPIGWHRDAPQYDMVAGVSLLSPARMRFRPYVNQRRPQSTAPSRRAATHEVTLEPRSAYLMTGSARSNYEHHVPPVTALRYSVTFRTLRSPANR